MREHGRGDLLKDIERRERNLLIGGCYRIAGNQDASASSVTGIP
jgi:hypothetical protein